MIDIPDNKCFLDLEAIRRAEFCPPAPQRYDDSQHLPEQVFKLLQETDDQQLAGFYTESTENPDQQALTIISTSPTADQRVVAVLDTLTHMNKGDLSPFLLRPHYIDGRVLHYGRFLVDADLRCTLGKIHTTDRELAEIASKAQWKDFFNRTQPLYPLLGNGDSQEQSILEPETLTLAEDTQASDLVHSALLPGLATGEKIRVKLFAPGKADKLLIACDGQIYLEDYPLWPAILHLNQTLFAPFPCALLLLEPAEQIERERFLGCENYLSHWLTSIGIPWVGSYMKVPNAENCLISGGSLGGLAAAYVVRNIPGTVSKAIVQSGSFWWYDPNSPGEEEGERLKDWLQSPPPSNIEIFHEVGSKEGYLLSWNLAFHKILTAQAVNHTHRIYQGGHDYACWRQGIVDALIYFFAETGRA